MFGVVQCDPRSLPGEGKGGGRHCIAFGVCEILVDSEVGDACGGTELRVLRNGVDVRIYGGLGLVSESFVCVGVGGDVGLVCTRE